MKIENKMAITKLLQQIKSSHRRVMTQPTVATGHRRSVMFLLTDIREKLQDEPGFESVKVTLTKLVNGYKMYTAPQGCRTMPEFHADAERQIKILSDDFEATSATCIDDDNMFRAKVPAEPRNLPNNTQSDVPQLSREEHEKKFKQEILAPKTRVDPHGMPTPIKIEGPLPASLVDQAAEEAWNQEKAKMKALGLSEEEMGD